MYVKYSQNNSKLVWSPQAESTPRKEEVSTMFFEGISNSFHWPTRSAGAKGNTTVMYKVNQKKRIPKRRNNTSYICFKYG